MMAPVRLWLLSAAATVVLQAVGYPSETSPSCKAVPGDSQWPSAAEWAKLNQTTEGRLLQPSPPGAVCHPKQATYSAAKCTEVRANWSSEFFHSNDPISVEWNNWSNDSCLPIPEANLTCSASGYPIYVINATTPLHIKAGIDFAKLHNIRLIVKNTGHDYLGRSIAPNSLSIWVHHMKGIKLHEKSYQLKGCNTTIDGAAMTALSGVQMQEAYEATAKINHTVVGGNGRTVGLGGFLTGGGHSILAPTYGLASDLVLEMEVVTPSGEIVTANECQNSDLFWAMRGGGGSTFGVLTSVTMTIIPSPELVSMEFYIISSADNIRTFDMISYVVQQFPDLADKGISGYPIVLNTNLNIFGGPNVTWIKGIAGKLIMVNTKNETDMMKLITPILNNINSTWSDMYAGAKTTYYPNFNAWYRDSYDQTPAGYESVMASRLLDRAALTSDPLATKVALGKFSSGGQANVFIVSGKGVHQAKPRGGGSSVHPVWRRAYVHATAGQQFLPQNEASKDIAIKATQFLSSSLREIAPNSGAYVNEASRYEPDWQQTFWGDNYARLLKIKRSMDPDDVFWCFPCVGSERWQENGTSLCRV